MWVLKIYGYFPTEGRRWDHGVFGHPKPRVLDLGREHQGDSKYTLLLSAHPFIVVDPTTYDEEHQPQGAYLFRARQVHKGELGHFVDIELPLVAREMQVKGDNRSRKRGHGWVRLTDVAEKAGLSVKQAVLDHWLFVDGRDRRGYIKQFKDVRIEMIHTAQRGQIHKQVVDGSLKLSRGALKNRRLAPRYGAVLFE
jgi:hypothetical protein